MKIIISGKPGVGKTTLVKKIIPEIKVPKVGFYTEEILKNGIRVGFKAVSLDDRKEVVLAHTDIKSPHRVGKYKINIGDFEPFVTEILGQVLKGKEEVVIIDEIGKMELFSTKFRQHILEVLGSPETVLVTFRNDWIENWIAKIKDKRTHHFELTRANFDHVFFEIIDILNDKKL